MTTYCWEINAITKTWAGPEKGRQKGNKTKMRDAFSQEHFQRCSRS